MMWEYVDLADWKTKEQILNELRMDFPDLNERSWRIHVEKQNELYGQHESEIFIAHSNKGYKIASNEEEIKRSARDTRARGIDQITKYYKIMKALGENANLKIIIENNEMFVEGELWKTGFFKKWS